MFSHTMKTDITFNHPKLSTSLPHDLSSTSSDSEDDTDQPLLRFQIVNPDSDNDSCHQEKQQTNGIYFETPTNLPTLPLALNSSSSPTLHNDHSTAGTDKGKTVSPVLNHSDEKATHLSRRQSKTLDTNAPPPLQQRSTMYPIPEMLEYQPHHSRASIVEPLTASAKKLSVNNIDAKIQPLGPPRLIIPPAPSWSPPHHTKNSNNNKPNSVQRSASRSTSWHLTKDDKTLATNTIEDFDQNDYHHQQTHQQDYHESHLYSQYQQGYDHQDEHYQNQNQAQYYYQQQQHYHQPSSVTDNNESVNGTSMTSQSPTSCFSATLPLTNNKPSAHTSKYSRASYSLANNQGALKLYREMAEKTQDPSIQLSYAKYLIEMAELYKQQTPLTATSDTEGLQKKKALEQEGIRWIRRLSKKGVGEAAFLEARWMETQQYGFKTRHAYKIDKKYQIAAQAGVPEASYRLAYRQETSGHTPSLDTFRLYQKAADLKCVQAIYASEKMAKVYLHGELDQKQHLVMGMNYLVSAVNGATTECHEPPYVLALILTDKYSKVAVPSELVKSYGGILKVPEYMEQAAKLGNMGAKNRSGHIYEHGSYGVRMDLATAFKYYEEAATLGDHLGAMLGLSRLYHAGCHGPNDHDEQLRLANDVSGWLRSHPQDEDRSFYWCQRAAKGGLPEALYVLGWYYEIGWGVPRSHQYSVECYKQAVAKGYTEAKERLKMGNSFTRQQHEETLGNINREPIVLSADRTGGGSNSKNSDDCVLM